MEDNTKSLWYRMGLKAMKLSSKLGKYSHLTIAGLFFLGGAYLRTNKSI
jgi:hypothetical protein